MLYNEINNKLKQAMLEKDIQTLNSIRVIKSRITEYLVQEKLPRDVVSDDVVVKVITIYKKGLQKAIDQLSTGGEKAEKLISEYLTEIKLCERYLPSELENITKYDIIISKVIEDMKVNSEKQIGMVVGHIMKNNPGFDGKLVKNLVQKRLRS